MDTKVPTTAQSRTTGDERRNAPRYGRILRVNCRDEAREFQAVTMDIGPRGVYLLTPGVPEPGGLVTIDLHESEQDEIGVRMLAKVVRKVPRASNEAHVPGSALRWISASTQGSKDLLRQVLKSTIGLETTPVDLGPDGGASYEFSVGQG